MVLVFADEKNKVADAQAAREALTPFLKSRILLISDRVVSGTAFFLENS